MLSRVLSLNTAQGASTEYHGYLYSLGDPTITLLYGFSITSIDYTPSSTPEGRTNLLDDARGCGALGRSKSPARLRQCFKCVKTVHSLGHWSRYEKLTRWVYSIVRAQMAPNWTII
jgi:hypothetical protein